MKRRALLLALPACAIAQTSKQQSATIYRCDPDGRKFSDRPCGPDAAGSVVRFDQPSSADRDATRQRAARDAKEAARLQREREQLEGQPSPSPQRLSAPPADAADKAPQEPPRKIGGGKPAKKKKSYQTNKAAAR
ncbi:MAG: hypothetical protein ACK4F7_02275 [Inhella sp.]